VSFRRHGSRDLSFTGLAPALVVLLTILAFGTHMVRTRGHTALPEITPRSMTMADVGTGWKQLPSRRIDVAGRDKQFLNLQWPRRCPSSGTHSRTMAGSAPPLTFATAALAGKQVPPRWAGDRATTAAVREHSALRPTIINDDTLLSGSGACGDGSRPDRDCGAAASPAHARHFLPALRRRERT